MDVQSQGLASPEVLRFASVIVVGMVMLLAAVASYFLERRHQQRPMFALTLALLGWVTLTLGSAMSGVGRIFPAILVMAPLLSGFTGPALLIHTIQLTLPHRTVSLKWLALGLFGTAYSVLSLTMPDGLDYAAQGIIHHRPFWHPVLSPLMILQSIQLAFCTVTSTVLITRAVWMRSRPDLIQTQFWLLVTCWTCLGIVVLTNVLPNFKIFLTQIQPALAILPIAVVGCLSVRALGRELQLAHRSQLEARSSRMESLGTMARGLAHDLNNILAAVTGHAEVAKLKLPKDHQAEPHLEQIVEGSQRAAELLNRMMTFSGRTDELSSAIDPRGPIQAAFDAIEPLQRASCQMSVEFAPNLPLVRMNSNALSSVIDNLLSNAIEAVGDQPGRVTVRVLVEASAQIPPDAVGSSLQGQHALRIEVEDTGVGMNAAAASRALEPFYSTRSDGKGLGLVGVLSTVKGSGGALWFRSEPGSGTRFVLWFPTSSESWHEGTQKVAVLPRAAIVVDDDLQVARVLGELLESLSVRAYRFASGEEVVAFVNQPTCPAFELAVVDIRLDGMDGMDGIELAHRLLHHHGCEGVVLVSGDEPGPRLAQFEGQPVVFMRKPLTLNHLREAMRKLRFVSFGADVAEVG